MEKRTSDIVKLINKLKRKYQAKRRVKNYDFMSGLVFELFRTNRPVTKAVKAVDSICRKYVDWNEFRVTPLKVIQHDLSMSNDDLRFLAQLKRAIQGIFETQSTFANEHYDEMGALDCVDILKEAGIDAEIAAVVVATYLDKAVMPLPDEILRIIKRLGIFPSKSSRRRVRSYFMKMGEEGLIDMYQTYRLLLHHAETACFIKEPDCRSCFLPGRDCRSARS
ncbi:hypothetical protein ACFL4W_04110 [Planctomycetota bacterium]